MSNLARLWSFVGGVFAVAGLASALPVQWDGDAGDGLWITAANWDGDSVPGSSADVTIPSDAGTVTIVLSAESCGTLSCESSLRLESGSISTTGASSVRDIVFTGGGFAPTVFAGGPFTISGSSSSISGQALGTGPFVNAGVFDAPFFGLNIASARNDGSWSVSANGGWLTVNGSTQFTNNDLIELSTDSAIDGTGTLINSGTVTYANGPGFATISSGYNQTGGTLLASGANTNLDLTASGWTITGGGIDVIGGGRVYLGGGNTSQRRTFSGVAFSGQGTVGVFANNDIIDYSGTNTVNVTGDGFQLFVGTHNIAGSLTNSGRMAVQSALITGAGSFTNAAGGVFTIVNGNGANLGIDMTNHGTVDLDGTLFLIGDAQLDIAGGSLVLRPGSVIDTLTAPTPGELASSAAVSLTGAAAGEVAEIRVPVRFEAGSTLSVEKALLTLSGGGVVTGGEALVGSGFDLPGTLLFDGAGLTYSFTGDYAISESASPAVSFTQFGTWAPTGPTLSIAAAKTLTVSNKTRQQNATIAGPGTLRSIDTYFWLGGSIGCVFKNDAILFIEAGTPKTLTGSVENHSIAGQADALYLDGGTITNAHPGATWTLSFGGSVLPSGSGGTFHNTGFLQAQGVGGSGLHEIGVTLDNTGTVTADAADLFLTGPVAQFDLLTSTLSGGTWTTSSGGRIFFSLGIRQLSGDSTVHGSPQTFPGMDMLERIEGNATAKLLDSLLSGPLTNDGATLNAEGDVHIQGNYSATNGSRTTVQPTGSIEATGGIDIGGVDSAADDLNPISVIARGSNPAIIASHIDIFGSLTIGSLAGGNTVNAQGGLMFHPSARFRIGVRGDAGGAADSFVLDGDAVLGGTIELTEVPGPNPADGQAFVVLSAGSITGQFDALDAPCHYALQYTPTEVRLVYSQNCGCNAADLAEPFGLLDLADITAFASGFLAMDPIADLVADGLYDLADINAFISAFTAGCP